MKKATAIEKLINIKIYVNISFTAIPTGNLSTVQQVGFKELQACKLSGPLLWLQFSLWYPHDSDEKAQGIPKHHVESDYLLPCQRFHRLNPDFDSKKG